MSQETDATPHLKKARVGILITLAVVSGVLWGAYWYLLARYVGSPSERGQFGDMFGAVNALFTALAFAGLIYTVLLQRDQLALQQRQMSESAKTQQELLEKQLTVQKKLAEAQQAFEEQQRRKQVEHELALEKLRDELVKAAEGRQSQRELEVQTEFERNLLLSIRVELESLSTIYDEGMGGVLKGTPAGQPLNARLAISQDWFTVFTANATHLGRIDGELSRRVVRAYALNKALIEEYRINNELLTMSAGIEFDIRQRPQEIHLQEKGKRVGEWMIAQAHKIRKVDEALRLAVLELFSALDKMGIK